MVCCSPTALKPDRVDIHACWTAHERVHQSYTFILLLHRGLQQCGALSLLAA